MFFQNKRFLCQKISGKRELYFHSKYERRKTILTAIVAAGRAKVVNHKDETVQTTVTLYTNEQAQKVAEENKYLTWVKSVFDMGKTRISAGR